MGITKQQAELIQKYLILAYNNPYKYEPPLNGMVRRLSFRYRRIREIEASVRK